ncbi:MAG: SDR family oxidoreductase [Candidatus Izemoplasmataceae bacterium]
MKTVLLTGANGGIGHVIAKDFLDQGYRVYMLYNRHSDRIKPLSELYPFAYMIQCNLQDKEALKSTILKIKDEANTIDVLINNAGIKKDGAIDALSYEDFHNVIDTNFLSVWQLIKEVVPLMKLNHYGRIINITSGVAKEGRANQTNYAASKAALENLTRSLAKELGPFGITVNAVAPGLIETDMTKGYGQNLFDSYKENVPIKRLVTPKDISTACQFFAQESAGAISGQILGVNGGLR